MAQNELRMLLSRRVFPAALTPLNTARQVVSPKSKLDPLLRKKERQEKRHRDADRDRGALLGAQAVNRLQLNRCVCTGLNRGERQRSFGF